MKETYLSRDFRETAANLPSLSPQLNCIILFCSVMTRKAGLF